MIILYGDKEEADRYFNLLNITKQLSKEVFIVYKDTLSNINNLDDVLKVVEKVFICQCLTPAETLKNDLISYGCCETKIDYLNEYKIRLAFMMHDMNYTTIDHKVISYLLSDFNKIVEVYKDYLQLYYNQDNEKVDIVFDLLVPNHHAHIVDLSLAMSKQYTTKNYYLEEIDNMLNNFVVLEPKDRTHASTQMTYLHNYKVLISPSGQGHPTATTVHMLHNMIQKPVSKYHIFREYTNCDYTLMTTMDMFNKSKKLLEEYQHLLKKEVCLIPFGYPKLDKITNDLEVYKKNNKSKRRAICYAPTILKHTKEFMETLSLNDGEYIIGELLKNFKDYDIIFRPHPDTKVNNAGIEYVEEVISKYSDNKRFIYDSSMYYLDTFAKSDILISDFSSIGQTFAFSTSNPLLSLSREGFDKQYEKVFGDKDFRDNYGLVLNDVEKLSQTIQYIIDNKEKIKNKIEKYREEQVFNFRGSVDYFVDNFEYIANKKKNKDWFYISPNSSN